MRSARLYADKVEINVVKKWPFFRYFSPIEIGRLWWMFPCSFSASLEIFLKFIFSPIRFHDFSATLIGPSVGKYLSANQHREKKTKPVERVFFNSPLWNLKFSQPLWFFFERDGPERFKLDTFGRELFRNMVGHFFSLPCSRALLLDGAFKTFS